MCAYTVTTREAPASVRYEFPVCGHIVLWTSLVTVVSRQPASRRQSDTGFSKLRAAGAQYYCTVVASLSDRRSRSHGLRFLCVLFYTTRLPSTVDLI